MQFYELVIRAHQGNEDVINVLWYRNTEANNPTPTRQQQIVQAWITEIQPFWLAPRGWDYVLDEATVTSYDTAWNRAPYLTYSQSLSGTGARQVPVLPPSSCAILACRVEPTVPAKRDLGNGQFEMTPVRRGYWAMGGIPEDKVDHFGRFTDWNVPVGDWGNVAIVMADELNPTGWVSGAHPIKVSKPYQNETARGYGIVVSCLWREAISSRRSRKMGIGS